MTSTFCSWLRGYHAVTWGREFRSKRVFGEYNEFCSGYVDFFGALLDISVEMFSKYLKWGFRIKYRIRGTS